MRPEAGYRVLYLVGGFLMFAQIAELVLTLFEPRPSDPAWRFAAVGLAVGRTSQLLIADALIGWAAFGLQHRAFLRVWSVLHVVAGVVLLLTLAGFGLDALTVRRMTKDAAQRGVELGTVRSLVVGLAAVAFLVWAGLKTFALTKARPSVRGANVVVGGGS